MATQYNENQVLSIYSLVVKNREYLKKIRDLTLGIQTRDSDIESYLVETEYGNKIVKIGVVSPNVALITLGNIYELQERIKENNALIRSMAQSMEVYSMDNAEVDAFKTAIGLV